MSSLLLPLILFLGFIGFRIASIMATRKREAQLRAATVALARDVRDTLGAIIRDAEQLHGRIVTQPPVESAAELARITASAQQLQQRVESQLTLASGGAPT